MKETQKSSYFLFKKMKCISSLRLDRLRGLVLLGLMAKLQGKREGDKETVNILASCYE
jgi:hypothetical protein